VQNAGISPSYQWQLNGATVGSNLPGYSNAHLRDGDIVGCLLTGDNVACSVSGSALSNPVTVSVNQPPVIDLQPQDTILPPGKQLILRASVTGLLQSWQWTPAGDLTDPLSLTPLTTPMVSTTPFQLTVLSAEGCQASKTVLVKVYIKLAMPNSFTPNGDGKNDLFRIPASVGLQLKEFAVFSRWGNKIFSTNNIGQGWDGASNGTVCPPGTYVWFINGSTKDGPVFAKGTVILVR
jgi:gliding motility-associated-like protein